MMLHSVVMTVLCRSDRRPRLVEAHDWRRTLRGAGVVVDDAAGQLVVVVPGLDGETGPEIGHLQIHGAVSADTAGAA